MCCLPWFPDLKRKVTVRHLLYHTSGIRDYLQLQAISGLGIDGRRVSMKVWHTPWH